jgi:hypothetical protein
MLGTLVLRLLCSELGVCFFLCFGDSLVLLLFFSFLFFVLELWFCFFCVLHDGKLCICEVCFLLAFRGWRGKGNKLAVGKKLFQWY